MTYENKIVSGLRSFKEVHRFLQVFPGAEHVIVQARRELSTDRWQVVDEWISRASLYDRYAIWLVVAIEFRGTNSVSALECPEVYIIEVEDDEGEGDVRDRLKWNCSVQQIDEGEWDEIIESNGDFDSVGADLIKDAPVRGFATFWRDTCPRSEGPSPDGMAFRAPLRFILQ